MKSVKVSTLCKAVYYSTIEVPDDLTNEEIRDYANTNMNNLIVNDIQFLEDIPESAELVNE